MGFVPADGFSGNLDRFFGVFVFYFAYYAFYDLVRATIGENGLCNFYDLFLLTLPFFALGFIIILFITDALIVKRMNKNAV